MPSINTDSFLRYQLEIHKLHNTMLYTQLQNLRLCVWERKLTETYDPPLVDYVYVTDLIGLRST